MAIAALGPHLKAKLTRHTSAVAIRACRRRLRERYGEDNREERDDKGCHTEVHDFFCLCITLNISLPSLSFPEVVRVRSESIYQEGN